MSLTHVRTATFVLAAALAVATLSVIKLVTAQDDPSAVTDQASVDSLTAQVVTAGWTAMDHDMSSDAPGYQMPPAMMPGMPENGDQRLAISIMVVNTSDATRPLRVDKEFALHAGKNGRQWAPHSDTFGDLPRLPSRNAVKGILFFDLPPAELTGSSAWIEWTHGDTTSRLTIPLDGTSDQPSHSHNP
jgi:hypothetical protein